MGVVGGKQDMGTRSNLGSNGAPSPARKTIACNIYLTQKRYEQLMCKVLRKHRGEAAPIKRGAGVIESFRRDDHVLQPLKGSPLRLRLSHKTLSNLGSRESIVLQSSFLLLLF